MNILVDKFPTKTMIDDKEYTLNTDFRNCLKIMFAFEDKELFIEQQIEIMLELLYGKDNIPDNIEKAVEKAILFLDCGEKENDKNKSENSRRVYSFNKDAKYIYSAIKQTHNIDLENIEYLHWWKFVYLFLDLDKDCFFCKLIDLRNKKNKGKLTKEEKNLYVELYDILEIENAIQYTEEEQEEIDEFMKLLKGGTQK